MDPGKKSYRLTDRDEFESELKEGAYIPVTDEVVRVRQDDKYRERFRHFSRFYEEIKGEPYPSNYADQATLTFLESHSILILGLNSAWKLDHHFKARASIDPLAMARALDRIDDERFKDWLKFAVWHHPLNSSYDDRITDHGFMERLAQTGFSVGFHGHLHNADTGLFSYDHSAGGRRIHMIGAGTFGAPPKEWTDGYPLQYNLIRIQGKQLIVETRRRAAIDGAWKPDAIWTQGPGKDPLPRYCFELPLAPQTLDASKAKEKTDVARETLAALKIEKDIRAYFDKAAAFHADLPLAGFKTRIRVPVRIEDIYIHLRAMPHLLASGDACYANAEDAQQKLHGCGLDKEISLAQAFRWTEKLNRGGIVILGDPGSGKTTHLKRLLLYCYRQGPEAIGLPAEMIPVFLPLRELRDINNGLGPFIQEQLSHPHLDTPQGFGQRLMQRGNLLFLLDGLDEVADPAYRSQVSRWIEDACRYHHTNCRFVVTSRFAGYTQEARLDAHFLEMHVMPLNQAQAETFICKWYEIVETGLSLDRDQAGVIADQRASGLIERLRAPEFRARRVFEMTRNPLLLANLCLVHRDRGDLPRTRAKLYEECIDVLLERWRRGIGIATRITAQNGRRLLQPAALWMHSQDQRTLAAADELAPVIEPAVKAVGWKHGKAADFLGIVRDESGLLTGWSGDRYGFMHLGFQEYLAAREIRSRAFEDNRVLKELALHFGQGWWQEVILILLALEEPSLFKPFMREVVALPAFADNLDLVELCLDEAAEVHPEPFIELLRNKPGDDAELWRRQLAALRIVERLDGDAFEVLAADLREHPYDQIRELLQTRFKEERQDVIVSEPSGYELVYIPGGVFMMGSPESEKDRDDDEGPQHEVSVPAFYMGRYPVTNAEYGKFLSQSKDTKEPAYWGDRKYNQLRQPVVGVSWNDAKAYADWAGLSLPSEAQWEYACRAGTTTRYYTGDSETDLDRAGWYDKNSDYKLHVVGEKEPNACGLYDMHGNVYEWVEDDWHENYEDAPADGRAWVGNPRDSHRVLRGGSWISSARYCRSANRLRSSPGYRHWYYGFRLVLPAGHFS